MRYSLVIATWNARDALAACLESVAAQELDGALETIVVDNASTDGTDELLRGVGGDVRVIANHDNVGYSAGINQGARAASGEVLFLANSDTVLRPGALQRLADGLRRPRVGLAAPRYEWPDGSLQPGCANHPSVGRALLLGSGAHRLLPDRVRARLAPEAWSHDHTRTTGSVMGALLCIRAELFAAIGGFWPLMYASEQDLALAVRRRGLSVLYVSDARVTHEVSHSNRQRYPDAGRSARVARAELALLERHYGVAHRRAIRAVTGVGHALRALLLRALGHSRARAHAALARVYLDGRPAPPLDRDERYEWLSRRVD